MSNRFQSLLTPLVLLILAQPLVAEGTIPGYTTKVLTLLAIVGAFRILQPHRKLIWVSGILFVVAAVAVPADQISAGWAAHLIGGLASVAALTIITVVIAYEAVSEHWVTRDTLFGALAVYLLIGVTSTVIYELMEVLAPGSFTNLQGLSQAQLFAELNYFSLVTLTTLGYGDIAPVAPMARTMAAGEAIVGQFFVAAVVGLLISRGGAQLPTAAGTGRDTASSSNKQQD
ncbi:MAG: potassium channel family protein [Gemmatimonadales bacterium]